jgi:ABC-type transport system substrate-binding protein
MHDSPERRALYRQMADIVIEDCPWVFASQPIAFVLRQPWLHNHKRHDFPYGMEKYFRIDAAARAEARKARGG